jgi:hypothetical protein
VSVRQAVLDAVLVCYPHDDPASLPKELGRYAVVQQFKDGSEAFWIDLCDEPEEALKRYEADYEDSGYLPILVVELDDGRTWKVRDFSLGAEIERPEFQFAARAAVEPSTLSPPGPRARLSELADGPRAKGLPSRPDGEELSQ